MDKKLIVLFGPSGAGIREIAAQIFEDREDVVPVVPVTARKKKAGERDGESYYFFELEDWNAMKDAGDLIETTELAGNDYGTSRRLIEERFAEGYNVLMEREPERAAQIKKNMPEALCVYVEPSPPVLEERLRAVSKSERELALRLQTAERLRAEADFCDLRVNSDDYTAAVVAIGHLLDFEE